MQLGVTEPKYRSHMATIEFVRLTRSRLERLYDALVDPLHGEWIMVLMLVLLRGCVDAIRHDRQKQSGHSSRYGRDGGLVGAMGARHAETSAARLVAVACLVQCVSARRLGLLSLCYDPSSGRAVDRLAHRAALSLAGEERRRHCAAHISAVL